MKRRSFNFDSETLYLSVYQYQSNGRIAIIAKTSEEDYADVTINIPGMAGEKKIIAIDKMTERCGLMEKLIELGVICLTEQLIKRGMENYKVAKINYDQLRLYDAEGCLKYNYITQNM